MESSISGSRDTRFAHMQDEEVVGLAKGGHGAAAEFLISRYRPLVETKAKAYFVIGADREDVIQEGMIGLCKAIRDYRGERLTKFRAFAELCVTRQIITAVKTATRQKHVPLNASVSLNGAADSEGSLIDVLPCRSGTAVETAPVSSEKPQLDETVLSSLSDLERRVLTYYLRGMTYMEMSRTLDRHTKSVDNALQRVKRKIGVLMGE